ncbi:GNAT family N-acetyltransferase [Ramlibacter albus]|uniref:GNAT family N-acetyltransferase n=1 Tax=Ramlibacter albus TaxID=2079448 RepID=A0A923MA28_9BURK|nr:GNAT family N-acetyltransferase [Ramlibacter albus]MBC5766135.1 GNAT family N-acetyltransferase [Ramlibacter albus]
MDPKYLAPRVLETDRLVLRPFTLADHADYARITSDPDVMRYMGTGIAYTPDIAWRAIASVLGHWELLGYGLWAVTLKETGALIGHAGFLDPYGWPGFELAYMIDKPYWGQGYAQEATRAALKVARETLRKERIISLVRPANEPSRKLALRLGAVQEGTVSLMGSDADLFVHRV